MDWGGVGICDLVRGDIDLESDMSRLPNLLGGNKLYLTCICGLDPIELARRSGIIYSESKEIKYHFDQWLTKHSKCGDGPDHWKLAHASLPNWDQSTLATPVQSAIRLELLKS